MKAFVALIGGLVAVLVLAGQLARASSGPAVPNDGFPAMAWNGVDVAFWRDSPSLGARAMDGTAAGTSIHAVASGFLRGWLPGTERVLVQSGTKTLLLPDNDRYQAPFATFDGVRASASPEGLRVAYLRGQSLYVASSDGSGEHAVATGVVDPGIDVTGAAWSPDGTRLAYASGSDLYVVRADGTRATRVYAGGGAQTGNPSWSADGTTIAFETNAGPYWAVREVGADGSASRTVTGSYDARFPRFSPVGGALAYISDQQHVPGGATPYQYALYVRYAGDLAAHKLVDDVKPDSPPAWSPTAAQILVSAGQECRRFGIYVLRPQAAAHVRRLSNRCRFEGSAKADVLTGSQYLDIMRGFAGDDTIRGLGGNDRIEGNGGNDTLVGGAGRDALFGGLGNDRIVARDGERDLVVCGPGRDVAIVDRHDVVNGCERVLR